MNLTPAGSFQAVTEKLDGVVLKKNGVFTSKKISIKVEDLKTGIDLRDEHLWKHLNAPQNQQVILSDLSGQNGKAKAYLEVGGIKKLVDISFKEKGSLITGEINVKASEFKLPPAEYFGVGVDDQVLVKVEMPFKEI